MPRDPDTKALKPTDDENMSGENQMQYIVEQLQHHHYPGGDHTCYKAVIESLAHFKLCGVVRQVTCERSHLHKGHKYETIDKVIVTEDPETGSSDGDCRPADESSSNSSSSSGSEDSPPCKKPVKKMRFSI